jgi:hypothetical protein
MGLYIWFSRSTVRTLAGQTLVLPGRVELAD